MTDPEASGNDPIDLKAHILIRTETESIAATADFRNISLQGIYLVPEKKLPANTSCTLEITLIGETSKLTTTIPGRIGQNDDQGMRVDFLDMKVDSYVHIKNLLNLQIT